MREPAPATTPGPDTTPPRNSRGRRNARGDCPTILVMNSLPSPFSRNLRPRTRVGLSSAPKSKPLIRCVLAALRTAMAWLMLPALVLAFTVVVVTALAIVAVLLPLLLCLVFLRWPHALGADFLPLWRGLGRLGLCRYAASMECRVFEHGLLTNETRGLLGPCEQALAGSKESLGDAHSLTKRLVSSIGRLRAAEGDHRTAVRTLLPLAAEHAERPFPLDFASNGIFVPLVSSQIKLELTEQARVYARVHARERRRAFRLAKPTDRPTHLNPLLHATYLYLLATAKDGRPDRARRIVDAALRLAERGPARGRVADRVAHLRAILLEVRASLLTTQVRPGDRPDDETRNWLRALRAIRATHPGCPTAINAREHLLDRHVLRGRRRRALRLARRILSRPEGLVEAWSPDALTDFVQHFVALSTDLGVDKSDAACLKALLKQVAALPEPTPDLVWVISDGVAALSDEA